MNPFDANRSGRLLLAAGIIAYLVVLAVCQTGIGIRPEAAAKATSILVLMLILFPLGGLVLFGLEAAEGIVTGTPRTWYAYCWSEMKRNWMGIVGAALLVIALLALAAATI
jgi:hypothetical protein